MNLIRTSCIRIPLQFETEKWCQQIIKDLTRTSPSYDDPSKINTTTYCEKRDGYLLIPRFYPVEQFGHKVISYLSDGKDIDIEFKSTLRSDLQKQSFEMMTTENHGLLKLKPGEGKTVISIAAICKLKKKSIIFTHKDSLLTQWKERFLEHSTISEDEIEILTTADREDVLKKSIVLCTVQTMNSMIDRLPNIESLLSNADFGISVHDEAHTTSGAEKFSRSALYIPCKKTFGLSATPGRADHNHDIIWHHLGQVFEPEGQTDTMKPKIKMLYFDHKVISNHKRYVYWGIPDKDGKTKLPYPKFDSSRYLQMLTSKKNDTYIPMMQKIVRKIYDSGRTPILISDRINILDLCAQAIPNKEDVGFFIPRTGKDRDKHLQKKFVFSTPGSSRDGTDKQSLDTLIMANRISNIEQAIGRVCRFKVNKLQPVVFDVVDSGCEDLVGSSVRRKEFYTQQGWEIEEKHL